MHRMEVIHEDNHLLVVNKPAGLSTMGAPQGTNTAVTWAKQYLRKKYNKPGNVYLGVVSRLDKPVSGLLLLARTSKSAARLTKSFQQRHVDKRYWAIVSAANKLPTELDLRHTIRKNETQRRMECCDENAPDAQVAELHCWTRHQQGNTAWLEIKLITGRKHQIRVQLETAGIPILGDRRYGSRVRFADGIALHAHALQVPHPIGQRSMTFHAPLPAYWPPRPPGWTDVPTSAAPP